MKSYSLSQVDDHVLLRDLVTLVSQDRTTTAAMLAHLAEVEERKLYDAVNPFVEANPITTAESPRPAASAAPEALPK